MNVEILKKVGIDYDYCVKRFAGRANIFEKALSKFTRDGTFSRIRAAYQADDGEGLLANAHEFKGMCGNIGLTPLYEGADAIVKMLRGGEFSRGELDAAYSSLEKSYDIILAAAVASMEETE